MKDAKAKAVKDRKFVIATCKAKAVAKKRSASFPPPRPRGLRQDPKVDKLCTKLAEAPKVLQSLPGCITVSAVLISPHSHSHKKCKGINGSPYSANPRLFAPRCPRSKRWQWLIRG
jgi:hypothetical protein